MLNDTTPKTKLNNFAKSKMIQIGKFPNKTNCWNQLGAFTSFEAKPPTQDSNFVTLQQV